MLTYLMDKKQNKTYTFSHPFFERNLFFLFLVASVHHKKTAHRHLRYLGIFFTWRVGWVSTGGFL